MKVRVTLTATFVCIVHGLATPVAAHAREIGAPAPIAWVSLPERIEAVHARMGPATLAMLRAERPLTASLSRPTTDVRLSSGAKTAIIVGAIVVGVLIIVGVVALKGPGPKFK